MESSREASHGLRLGEELQDETGLELSLGLSLSSTDSKQKWKASDGASARSSPSVDLAGESSAVAALNGLHPLTKPKPPIKASGLDAALKKFLEGRLDDQEESAKLLDGSNSFTLQKEKDKSLSAGSHEKPIQPVDMAAADVENKGTPFLFKELQGSSGIRSQLPAHTTPLQLVDAFKNTSNSGSPHSTEGAGHFDADDAIQDNSGQQKFHDTRKKRKHLIEEQKHQKKGKKEEKLPGFCRPGSNTWVGTSTVDMDKSFLGFKGDDAHEQIQQDTSQEKPDSAEAEMRLQGKGYETDGDESTGCEKNINADLGQNDTKGTSDESKGLEVNFMPQLKALETVQKTASRAEDDNTWHLGLVKSNIAMTKIQDRENPLKGVSTSPNNQKDGQALAFGREVDKAGSPLQRIREKVPSETSSVSTGGTEKMEEKSRGGEASSSVLEVSASEKASPLTSRLAAPFCPPAATTSSAPVPYPASPYPVGSITYSLPVSMPHGHGMPFPVGVNFPYMMQYVPPGSESSEQNMRPVGNSAFQPPGIEYSPPQMSPLEGASWMQAIRPPLVSPFMNPSNGALYSRNVMAVMSEDANARLPVTRMHDNGVGNVASAADTSSVQNHPLFRTVVQSGAHDQAPELSSLPIPAVPHFTSQHGISDHGELRSSKEQNGMNAFPGFAASVQAAQVHAPPGPARPPSSSGAKEDGGQEQAKFGGGRLSSPVIQQHVHSRNVMEPSYLGQEEFRKVVGSQFHQGSTENLSVLDGLGEDMAFLQYGIAPGLKFGGTGTAPDLPWVNTTGPNGRTIGGVLYRLSRTQLRVVCACHGKHMSPVEFSQHASGVDVGNTDKNVVVNSPLTTHAA